MKSWTWKLVFSTALVFTVACSHQFTQDQLAMSDDFDSEEESSASYEVADNSSFEPVASDMNEDLVAAMNETPSEAPEVSEEPSAAATAHEYFAADAVEVPSSAAVAPTENSAPAPAAAKPAPAPKKTKKVPNKRVEKEIANAVAVAQAEPTAPAVRELAEEDAVELDHESVPQLASPELSPLMAIRNHLLVAGLGVGIVAVWFFVAWRRKRKDQSYMS